MSHADRRQLTLAAKTMTPAQTLAFCQFLVESELETAIRNSATRYQAAEYRAALNGLRVIKQRLESEENFMCNFNPALMSDDEIRTAIARMNQDRQQLATVLDQRLIARKTQANNALAAQTQANLEAHREANREMVRQYHAAQEAEQAAATVRRQAVQEGTPQERTRAKIKAELGVTV